MPTGILLVIIGVLGGLSIGFFGIGGGIVLIPALMFWGGFSQHMATGTTIAVLLPPIGLGAALEYYRHGNVDVRAAIILAVVMFLTAWIGAYFANRMNVAHLRLAFGAFVCSLGIHLMYSACERLGWI